MAPHRALLTLVLGASVALGAPAAGSAADLLLAPTLFASASKVPSRAQIAHDASGNTTALWTEGSPTRVALATRPYGGSTWSAPEDVPVALAAGESLGTDLLLAENDAGDVTVAWTAGPGGPQRLVAITRLHGQPAFGAPQTVAGAGEDPQEPGLAMGSDGSTTLTWITAGSGDSVVRAALRTAVTGAFAPPATVSDPAISALDLQASSAPDGSVGLSWLALLGDGGVEPTLARRVGGSTGFEPRTGLGRWIAQGDDDEPFSPLVTIANGGGVTALAGRVGAPQVYTWSAGQPPTGRCPTKITGPILAAPTNGIVTGVRTLEGGFEWAFKRPGDLCFTAGVEGSRVPVPPLAVTPTDTRLTTTPSGGMFLSWSQESRRIAYRPPVPAYQPYPTFTVATPAPAITDVLTVTPDDFGNGAVAWADAGGSHSAIIDREPPRIASLSVPDAIDPTASTPFSVAAADAYSPALSYRWTINGRQVSDAASFSRVVGDIDRGISGAPQIAVRVTDGAGNAVERSVAVRLQRSAPIRLAPPRAIALKLGAKTVRRVKAADEGLDRGKLRKGKGGIAFTISSPDAGQGVFQLTRLTPGRRAKGKCRTSAKRGPRCTAEREVFGATLVTISAGTSKFRLTGAWSGDPLRPGTYRMTGHVEANGQSGPSASVTFRVVR